MEFIYLFNADKYRQRMKNKGFETPSYLEDLLNFLHGKKVEEVHYEDFSSAVLNCVPGFGIEVCYGDCDIVESPPPKIFAMEKGEFRMSFFYKGSCINHEPEDEAFLWLVLEKKENNSYAILRENRTALPFNTEEHEIEREATKMLCALEEAMADPMLMFDCYCNMVVDNCGKV